MSFSVDGTKQLDRMRLRRPQFIECIKWIFHVAVSRNLVWRQWSGGSIECLWIPSMSLPPNPTVIRRFGETGVPFSWYNNLICTMRVEFPVPAFLSALFFLRLPSGVEHYFLCDVDAGSRTLSSSDRRKALSPGHWSGAFLSGGASHSFFDCSI